MSTESTDTTRTASDADDRTDAVPEGGFAPTVELDELASGTAMPPPPPGSGTWNAASGGAEPEGRDHRGSQHASAGHFPSATPTSAPMAPTTLRPAARAGDDGVIFFGDGAESPAPSGWVSDDDPDLILPIEPARLVSWGRVLPSQPESMPDDNAGRAESEHAIPDEAVLETEDEATAGDEVDTASLAALAGARLARAGASVFSELESFLDDDAGEFVGPRFAGSVVCLAGSEIARLVTGLEPEPIGVSLEIAAPHRVPLGVRFPVELVTTGEDTTVEAVGGISVTAVGGELDITATFGERLDDDFAEGITRRVERLAAAINRRCDEGTVVVTKVVLDTNGAIRIEVERG